MIEKSRDKVSEPTETATKQLEGVLTRNNAHTSCRLRPGGGGRARDRRGLPSLIR